MEESKADMKDTKSANSNSERRNKSPTRGYGQFDKVMNSIEEMIMELGIERTGQVRVIYKSEASGNVFTLTLSPPATEYPSGSSARRNNRK